MNNIWQKLANKKPFFVLAPMAGVTDFPFREIVAEIGKHDSPKHSGGGPDLFFTEFVSTEMIFRRGAVSAPDGGIQVGETPPLQLHFSKKQRPIIAQFFGCKPEQFEYCANLALKLGFDGIDINMGCPDKKVQKQGSGSELIRNPELVCEIIRAVKRGCEGKLPISIKTRLGWDEKNIEKYLEILKGIIAEGGISAITIHGRTVKQGYSGNADWEKIGMFSKEIKKKLNKEIIIVGNGDVKNLEHGKMLAEKYGVDGVMIGREILRNPWVFCRVVIHDAQKKNQDVNYNVPTIRDRIKTALKHTELFERFYNNKHQGSEYNSEPTNIGAMKKYYKAYFAGVGGDVFAKKELMKAKNVEEVKKVLL